MLVDRSHLPSWPATVDEDGRDVQIAGATVIGSQIDGSGGLAALDKCVGWP